MDQDNIHVSATLPSKLYGDVKEMADREDRSISKMIAVLVQNAVNERTRKKKKTDGSNR